MSVMTSVAGAGFPYSKLITRTLYLQVFDYDRFSRDDPIGEVCLPLSDIDLSTTQTMWKTLQPCKGHVVSQPLPVSVCRCLSRDHYVRRSNTITLQFPSIGFFSLFNKATRHKASTSMYSLTFCVHVMSPERHHWKSAVHTAAVMLRTPPVPSFVRRTNFASYDSRKMQQRR